MIKLISIAIVAGLFFESNQQSYGVPYAAEPSYRKHQYFDRRCWTDWFDRDDPSGTGDWEDLSNLRKENKGRICAKPLDIEARTLLGLSPAAAGEIIHKCDIISGFICRNEDQCKKKGCSDYRVRFRCPMSFCNGDKGPRPKCWTEWFDRDDPSGSGDWENLSNLLTENPEKICSKPLGIQARTLSGLSAAEAGDVIHKTDTASGFICRNKDQPKGNMCNDYRVRFRCRSSFCDGGGPGPRCWTEWFDRDNPSGTGDWESLINLRKENPGKICPKPLDIQARTLSGLSAAEARDVIHKSDTASGFVCRNKDQPKKKKCNDYRVRFRCPSSFCDDGGPGPKCWTEWFDRDNPSGSGDWEDLPRLRKDNKGKICAKPLGIQARTLSGLSVAAAGDVIHKRDTDSGFVCRNKDQPKKKKCNDYRVRFRCPSSFCDDEGPGPRCWTEWFDRDNPSGSGDWEDLTRLRKDNKGKICAKPLGIQARTLSGLSVAEAGDVIHKRDTDSGFVCRNKDQPKKKTCNDYRVRFRCPSSFCDDGGPGPKCWTEWFDRDNPSGSGDWEDLPRLRNDNKGKICAKPLGIQARTLSGLSVAAAGDVIYKRDTDSGFVCRNKDQPKKKKCNDYRVRFRCPSSFCDDEGPGPRCWTEWFDRDNPSGSGDWEDLTNLRKENKGKICAKPLGIQARTLSGLSVAAAGDVIHKRDTDSGFVCRNKDQPKKKTCNDYRVRFRCPSSFCDDGGPGPKCWTEWFDRDNPSGSGDWEDLPNLRKDNKGKICAKPLGIQARTLSGLSVAAAGDVIHKRDTDSGFVCRNKDQPKKKKCNDYRVRFRCPSSFCDDEGPGPRCWTEWFDRDNPSGSGDWEDLTNLRKDNKGKICAKPLGIQARTLSGLSVAAAGDVIHKRDTDSGFVCRNKDQPKKKKCNDYRVRFRCPSSFCDDGGPGPKCWTEWFDRDNPSGTGDWEDLPNLRKDNKGKICAKPLGIQARTLSGLSVAAAGDVIHKRDTDSGFVCRNKDQPKKKKCNDYRVRFRCPSSFCDDEGPGPRCWTDWFDRDNPSGGGDWEDLPRLRKENKGKICAKPLGIQARTLSGLSVAAAGDVIHKRDTDSGFVCRNKDQPKKKKCNDYRVRFRCPSSFCDDGGPGPRCWTEWFDRDNPSGIGDWEDLTNLRKENKGRICAKPLGIQARTLSGLSVAAAGDVIHKRDTDSGFVCRNQDQPKNKKCNDYRVRFRCPSSFCDDEGPGPRCWTEWFDRDNPSGSGDWEDLPNLRKENKGKICAKPLGIQARTLSGLSVAAAGDVIHKRDTDSGFVCRNKDQPKNKKCNDYRVRFRCPSSFCDDGGPGPRCWTEWFDRDNPSGSGDWEDLTNLRKDNKGKICAKPLGIQARTLSGLSVAEAGDVIYKRDTDSGFVCRNQDQPKNKKCNDYRVRFRCPSSFCDDEGPGPRCWTEWFDRDNPSGSGDWEDLTNLRKENKGKICTKPLGIQARTLSGLSVAAAGDVIHKRDTDSGFVCRNKDQPKKKKCNDYRVRFRCPSSFCDDGGPGPKCWTEWFDRDNPSGTGDWEDLPNLRKDNKGKICAKPLGIQARTLSGLSVAAAGDVIHKRDTDSGFVCRNKDQPKKKKCNDYRVRFRCPSSFCDDEGPGPRCWTDWFDRDNPSGGGDWEDLPRLRKENKGKICAKPLGIQARTLSGLSVAAAGDVIHKSDTDSGFVCRNKDQPKKKKCNDYRVRFRCPSSFCDDGGPGPRCWTEWFDRDNPSGIGDWEDLTNLRKENKGRICAKPLGIQARTLSGLSVAAAGDVIHKRDTDSGFVCRNQDQPKNKKCNDYRVRFRCPSSFCDDEGPGPRCWTEWFDRDNPSGSGDWEDLPNLRKENKGKICAKPLGIQARTLSGLSVAAAGDVIHKRDTDSGFVCRNKDQPKNKKCNDYRVRFRCPSSFCDDGGPGPRCWTEWFDRDNPSGSGDWEDLTNLRKDNKGKICAKPLGIQARTLSGLSVAEAGDVIHKRDTDSGFVCRNKDQPKNKKCNDYRVRFRCPSSFCDDGGPGPRCWTEWFDRDNPSGSGDWEDLTNLRKDNKGKICAKPLGIQARTLSGLSVAAAGDVIYKRDTDSGFVCRNQDQPKNKKCNDYRVRFRCPSSFCDDEGPGPRCWTEWFDRDNPSGSGDWEDLTNLRKENKGKICTKPLGIQARTLSGLSVAAAGDVIHKRDTDSGFVCRNKDQSKNKKCNDYRVRFRCPSSFCDDGGPGPRCWTEWFDRDNPSGSGDWEDLPNLRKENKGKICAKPLGIQARTLSGLSVAAAGDVIHKRDTDSGFVCRNKDQPKKKKCNDYRVRFRCPSSFCDDEGPGPRCWTEWFDRDNPSGTGDWEDLTNLRKENKGKICAKPLDIQARTLSGLSVAAAGDVIHKRDTDSGFVCRNKDQPKKKTCNDYRVRFRCPSSFCDDGGPGPRCWTDWFDRDNPSGTGDWEDLTNLRKENKGKICAKPLGIQARTLSGFSVEDAGDVIYKRDTDSGFVCRNKDQPKKKTCNDYRVRFRCPSSFCDDGGPGPRCWTEWFDRDNPSGTGDWEDLPNLRKENKGKICAKPLGIQARTLSGFSVEDAGDVIYKNDTTSGFVCRNKDQPKKKKCNDYRVRFRCPSSFCDDEEPGPKCWTDWFDRDNPTGTGDWEDLPNLRKENKGKICAKPLGIQARTLSGFSVEDAGDVIYKRDTDSGFVCRNKDQPKKKTCNDYRVRFRCPSSFCDDGGPGPRCWTEWFDRDNPSGSGDWEDLTNLRKENKGKICAKPLGIQARTLSGFSVEDAGDVIYKRDTDSGFVCRNKDQPKKKTCNDYRVRFRCPSSFCDDGGPGPKCWTDWFDRDNPSGTGDWEDLPNLRKDNKGKICAKPLGIQARTLSGLSVEDAGDVIYKRDTDSGFVCRNKDQSKNKKCNDYRVRFRCPSSFCDDGGPGPRCWTEWFDRDNPSGSGDWEDLTNLRKENKGKICAKPLGIQARTLSGLSVAAAGDVIHKSDTTSGFVCRNKDQSKKKCNDYRVRFRCPSSFCDQRVCWTKWYDRDDPSGTGDWELLSNLKKENPGQICDSPLQIEAVTTDNMTPAVSTGEILFSYSPIKGFVCRQEDQKSRRCRDYKVRFGCPCK